MGNKYIEIFQIYYKWQWQSIGTHVSEDGYQHKLHADKSIFEDA